MTAQITKHDAALIQDITLQFNARFGKHGDSPRTFNVKFQFPPKIVSDSRKGEWVEAPLRGEEPVAVYAVSGAREITLQWTYIAGAKGGGTNYGFTDHDHDPSTGTRPNPNAPTGGVWDPWYVSRQVSALRSYFSAVGLKDFDKALQVRFRMWAHGGNQPFSCRILSVDVTHGTTLVTGERYKSPGEGGEGPSGWLPDIRMTYPLRTDITLELRLWTQGGSASAGVAEDKARGKSAEPEKLVKIALPDLEPHVPADWQ